MGSQNSLQKLIRCHVVQQFLIGRLTVLQHHRVFHEELQHRQHTPAARHGGPHGLGDLIQHTEILVDALFFSGEILYESFLVPILALAQDKFVVREHIAIEPLWVEFQKIDLVGDAQRFEQTGKGFSPAELPQIVQSGVKGVGSPLKWVQISAKRGHGLQQKDRSPLLGQKKGCGEASSTAADHDYLIISHYSLLRIP